MFGNKQNVPEFYEKFFIKLFFFFAVFSVLALSAYGQDKTDEYKKTITEAYKKLGTISYRLKSEQHLYIHWYMGISVTKTCEFIPVGKSNQTVVNVFWTDFGDWAPRRTEQIIEIDKKRYIKFNDEKWKEMTIADNEKLKTPLDDYLQIKDFSFAADLKIAQEETTSNNQQIQIYRATYSADKKAYEVRYQINAKGFLVETEWKVRHPKKDWHKVYVMLITETYEYDANIKIEAPKLN